MRALVLTTIITLASGGLVALAACGGSETTSGPVEDSGTGSETSSGGSSGSDARNDTGGSSSGNPMACNTMMQLGQQVEAFGGGPVGSWPTGAGGTVMPGTYVLTRALVYTPFVTQGQGSGQRLPATTIQISGTTAQAITTDNSGDDTHTLTFTTGSPNANSFSMVPTCSTAGDAGAGTLNFTGTYTAGTNDAGAQALRIYILYQTGTIIGEVRAQAEFTKQ